MARFVLIYFTYVVVVKLMVNSALMQLWFFTVDIDHSRLRKGGDILYTRLVYCE